MNMMNLFVSLVVMGSLYGIYTLWSPTVAIFLFGWGVIFHLFSLHDDHAKLADNQAKIADFLRIKLGGKE